MGVFDLKKLILQYNFFFVLGPGLVMEWQQHSQTLLVAGTARCVRLWDACTERKYVDISTGSLIMYILLHSILNGTIYFDCTVHLYFHISYIL